MKLPASFAPAGALRTRNYRFYAAGLLGSQIGSWMRKLAMGWLTWELTHSGAWLGIIAFADMAPVIFLSPLAGAVADMRDRLQILKVVQLGSTIQALLLAALALTSLINVWFLLVLALVGGVFTAFDYPTRLAFVSSVVPRPDLPGAVALNSMLFNAARFIGPALAGPLLAVWGAESVFASVALAYVLFFVLLWMIDAKAPPPAAQGGTFIGKLAEGMRYSIANPGVSAVLVAATAMTMGARPVADMLPGFAGKIFETGATGLAIMTAAMGLGSVIGALSMRSDAIASRPAALMIENTAIAAAAMVAFAVTPWFWPGVVAVALVSFGASRTGIAGQTSIHLGVPEAVRGRVLSLYGMIINGGTALGALLMGLASTYVGLRWPLIGGLAFIGLCWLYVYPRRASVSSYPPQE